MFVLLVFVGFTFVMVGYVGLLFGFLYACCVLVWIEHWCMLFG